MQRFLGTFLLFLIVSLPCSAQSRVTREAAAAALRGECLRVGNVGWLLAAHDIPGQLLLFTGAVREQRIIPATDLLTAPAGWIDGGILIDVDHREYHLFSEPLPQVHLCPSKMAIDQAPPVKLTATAPAKVADHHVRDRVTYPFRLIAGGLLRVFGFDKYGRYTQ